MNHLRNLTKILVLATDSKMETARVRRFSCFLFGNNCAIGIGGAK